MNKQEFLDQLRTDLSGLPQKDVEERVTFYCEIVDDRMEEGLSEEEAVAAVGSVEQIVSQAIADTPFAKIAMERIKPKRQMTAWEILLIVLGSPIWLALGISAVAVIFSIYVALWAVILALWAVFGSLFGSSLGALVSGIVLACTKNRIAGIPMIAAAIILTGLSIFAYYGCKAATKAILLLTKKIGVWIKNRFIRKEKLR